MASELNPGSGDIDRELTSVRNQLRNKVAVAREGKTQLETSDRAYARPAGRAATTCLPTPSCRRR